MATIDRIPHLIANNRTKEALTILKDFLKEKDDKLYHDAIIQLSKLKSIVDALRNGTLNNELAFQIKAQVDQAALEIYADAKDLGLHNN